MKTQIENAKLLFKDKDHYLAFKKAWSDVFQRGIHKQKDQYGKSVVSSRWHILYALLRGIDITTMIVPVTNANKTSNGHVSGIELGYYNLVNCTNKWREEQTTADLKLIFGDTVTMDMVKQIFN